MKTTSINTDPRSATHGVAAVGELFGDPARAAILVALLDGRARTAGELALAGNISAQSASGHFAKLTSGGLLVVRSQGRHRYYRIASPEVSDAIEALMLLATRPQHGESRPFRDLALKRARTCYDHLAGELGVAVTAALVRRGALALTPSGLSFSDSPEPIARNARPGNISASVANPCATSAG